MANNDGKLPRVYREQKQQGEDKDQGSTTANQEDIRGQQQGRKASPPSFVSEPINAVGPDLTIPGQHGSGQGMGNYQGHPQGNHPALFGENQLKNDLGPVYAIPSFPWHHGQSQGIGTENNPWHHSHEQGSPWNSGNNQGIGSSQWQQWFIYPQAMMPYYMYCPIGHRYYQ